MREKSVELSREITGRCDIDDYDSLSWGENAKVVKKLIKLCSAELVELMAEIDGENQPIAHKRYDLDEVIDEMCEEIYAEKLFGPRPKMDYQDWLKKCDGDVEFNQVWYDPQKIRELFSSIISGEYDY